MSRLIRRLRIALLGMALVASACAHGTDGLRQSCTNARKLLGGAYPLVSTAAHADLSTQRSAIADGGAKLKTHELAWQKAMSSLDAQGTTLDAACIADQIDAGEKGDVSTLEASVAGVVVAIESTIASVKDVLGVK